MAISRGMLSGSPAEMAFARKALGVRDVAVCNVAVDIFALLFAF
jgi:hypothetical protein